MGTAKTTATATMSVWKKRAHVSVVQVLLERIVLLQVLTSACHATLVTPEEATTVTGTGYTRPQASLQSSPQQNGCRARKRTPITSWLPACSSRVSAQWRLRPGSSIVLVMIASS